VNQIRFFTDEDLQGAIAAQLRTNGYDAVSTVEAGRLGEDDEAQLVWAAQQGRVLVTYNVGDFAQMHGEWMAAGDEHAGIIVSTQRTISDALRRLRRLASGLSAGDMRNRLEYLSDW
jgi:uncharacterized protein with PIN domain